MTKSPPSFLRALRVAIVTAVIGASRALAPTAPAADDYPEALKAVPQGSINDPWGFANRHCTSFVAWRLNRDGMAFANRMGGLEMGNASEWDDSARALGYRVDNVPAVGAVAQWNAYEDGTSYLGHVAYVEKVTRNGEAVIEEYNGLVEGGWSRDTLRAPRYIHFIDEPVDPPVEEPPVDESPTEGPSDPVINVDVRKTTRFKVGGKLLPEDPGHGLKVALYRKKAGTWRLLTTKRPTTNAYSRFGSSFTRPRPGSCRVRVSSPLLGISKRIITSC